MKIGIEGMSCQHCVKAVTDALTALPGVTGVRVSLEDKMAQMNAGGVDEAAVRAAIEDEGFSVTSVEV